MSTKTIPVLAVVDAYMEAWNAHDANACAELFTADGVRESMVDPTQQPDRTQGRSAIGRVIAELIAMVPDIHISSGRHWEVPDGVVLEWRATGTRRCDWETWSVVDAPGVSIFRVEDGRIAEVRMFWDAAVAAANWTPLTS